MDRANFRVKVGSYTGTGAYKVITGVGFKPDVIIACQGNANSTVHKFAYQDNGRYMRLANGSVDTTDSSGILSFNDDGFAVGAGNVVNASGETTHYVAIKGSPDTLGYGEFMGDGADNRVFTDDERIRFTPYTAFLKGESAVNGAFRCDKFHVSDSYIQLSSGANTTNGIQDMEANGFELGTSTVANGAGILYRYLCFPELTPACFKAGTYTGTGAEQTITGVGFEPDFIIIKSSTSTTGSETPTVYISTFPAGQAKRLTAIALTTDIINSTHSDGFTVGTNTGVSDVGDTMQYIAFKAGDFNIPVTRTAPSTTRIST